MTRTIRSLALMRGHYRGATAMNVGEKDETSMETASL
jgi:hypothetical protein